MGFARGEKYDPSARFFVLLYSRIMRIGTRRNTGR